MAKYLARRGPKCSGYFGVAVSESPGEQERPVIGSCVRCGCGFTYGVPLGWAESLLEITPDSPQVEHDNDREV